MSSITIRDLPAEVHKRLKESAQRNRRSLNAEILWQLERAVVGPTTHRPSNEEIQERADRFREHLRSIGFIALSDEEIREAIRQGRP